MTKVLMDHIPVMESEIKTAFLDLLSEKQLTDKQHREIHYTQNPIINEMQTAHQYEEISYFDGTLGRGGHLRMILKLLESFGPTLPSSPSLQTETSSPSLQTETSSPSLQTETSPPPLPTFSIPSIRAVAWDQDSQAIQEVHESLFQEIKCGRLILKKENFKNFDPQKIGFFDFILLDLGVSSPQLDQANRGFSFYSDGPLDMRMDQETPLTASDILNTYSEKDLISLFQKLGEVKNPFRVVRATVHDRKDKPFLNTRQWASLIERVDGWRKKGLHPATQYFMALRLEVNQELTHLASSITKMIHGLKPKGRLCVLTFHSLEDRIVKNTFKEHSSFGVVLTKKVIRPSRDEMMKNPRSRSAKLRIFKRN